MHVPQTSGGEGGQQVRSSYTSGRGVGGGERVRSPYASGRGVGGGERPRMPESVLTFCGEQGEPGAGRAGLPKEFLTFRGEQGEPGDGRAGVRQQAFLGVEGQSTSSRRSRTMSQCGLRAGVIGFAVVWGTAHQGLSMGEGGGIAGLGGVQGLKSCWWQLLPSWPDASICEILVGVGHGGGLLSQRCQLSSRSRADDMSSSHTAPGTRVFRAAPTSGARGNGVGGKECSWRCGNIKLSSLDEGDAIGLRVHAMQVCGPPHGKGVGVSCSCEPSFMCRANSLQLTSGVHCSVGITTEGAQSGV